MNHFKCSHMTDKDNRGITYSFDICSKCKSICCQDAKPPLTENRKKIIQKYLTEHNLNDSSILQKEEYSYPAVDSELYCKLFNKKKGKCMVHAVKPETCVAGPITFDIDFKTYKVSFFLKKAEICAYAGALFKDKASLKKHFEVACKEIHALIDQLNVNELLALMKIDEPQTFKYCEEPLSPEIIRKLDL